MFPPLEPLTHVLHSRPWSMMDSVTDDDDDDYLIAMTKKMADYADDGLDS